MGTREVIKLARNEFQKLEIATSAEYRFIDSDLLNAGVSNIAPTFDLSIVFVDEEDYAEYEKASKS